jgi:hypothetical protein
MMGMCATRRRKGRRLQARSGRLLADRQCDASGRRSLLALDSACSAQSGGCAIAFSEPELVFLSSCLLLTRFLCGVIRPDSSVIAYASLNRPLCA